MEVRPEHQIIKKQCFRIVIGQNKYHDTLKIALAETGQQQIPSLKHSRSSGDSDKGFN